jgi:hypothetical protein
MYPGGTCAVRDERGPRDVEMEPLLPGSRGIDGAADRAMQRIYLEMGDNGS